MWWYWPPIHHACHWFNSFLSAINIAQHLCILHGSPLFLPPQIKTEKRTNVTNTHDLLHCIFHFSVGIFTQLDYLICFRCQFVKSHGRPIFIPVKIKFVHTENGSYFGAAHNLNSSGCWPLSPPITRNAFSLTSPVKLAPFYHPVPRKKSSDSRNIKQQLFITVTLHELYIVTSRATSFM